MKGRRGARGGWLFDSMRVNPRRGLDPDIDRALASVPERVRDAALVAHERLRAAGVPHALVGGLAVAAHGFERSTQDVDFVLADEAFVGRMIKALRPGLDVPHTVGGVQIDYLTEDVSPGFDAAVALSAAHPDRLVVAPLLAIVLAKLVANRPKDRADIAGLVEAGHDVLAMRAAVAKAAPDLLPTFDRVFA